MNKKKLIFWGVVLLIGVMLKGCAGNYGGRGYNDGFPYYDYNYTPGYGGY